MTRMNSTEYAARANVNTGALPRLTLPQPVELRQQNRHGFYVLTVPPLSEQSGHGTPHRPA